MVDLDFAFFNILSEDRQGLIYQKFFLDRLAPVFFLPRVARLLELHELDSRVCNIVLPLGPGNLQQIDKEKKRNMLKQSQDLLDDFDLEFLAVDRRMKADFSELSSSRTLVYGDRFIQVLALALTRRALSRHAFRKIIITGETENFPRFLEEICRFQLPVSVQTPDPARFDIMAYRLLYEKGCTVTNSCLAPENWDSGDLVLAFKAPAPGRRDSRSIRCLPLYDSSRGLAPELEMQLNRCGLEGCLHHMAPVLESSLLSKAGYFPTDEEPDRIRENKIDLPDLEELGRQMGLWDQFLDKAL